MATSTVVQPRDDDRAFFGQPRALSTLFFTEMWERFSYYGMRALLVLYLTAPLISEDGGETGLGFDDGTAVAIYGAYSGLVYLTPIAGGWIADRIIGPRRTVLYGGIVIALGHYAMAVPVEWMFWIGLLLIALGTGLLKPNISALVGDLYSETDTRRDAGFSLFYMGINLGSLLAPLVTGFAANSYGFHWGFAIAGVGMTLAVIQYVLGWKHLHGVGATAPDPATAAERRRFLMVILGSVAFVAVLAVLLGLIGGGVGIDQIATAITLFILIVPFFYFYQLFQRKDYTERERSHVRAFVWVFIAAAAFWMVFEQSGSSLTLFAKNVTDLSVGSWEMPAAWLQSVNPLFIIIFAPIFATLWTKLADRAPRTSVKFALALIGVGISVLMLIIPMSAYQNNGSKAVIWWLLGTYLLQTWAELLLSPTGLSATSKLAPEGASGQMLALWFLATSVGTSVGGQIAKFTADNPVNTFLVSGTIPIVLALGTFAIKKVIDRSMDPVH
jgi:proton-dependent oligopeptide transporter, POT family